MGYFFSSLPCFLIEWEPFFGHAQIVLSPLDGFFFELLP